MKFSEGWVYLVFLVIRVPNILFVRGEKYINHKRQLDYFLIVRGIGVLVYIGICDTLKPKLRVCKFDELRVHSPNRNSPSEWVIQL